MWKCRQKLSSIQRTLLQKYQALLLSNQNDQFVGKKYSLKARIVVGTVHLGIFPPTALPTENPSTVCVSDASMYFYQLNSPCLRYKAFAQCGFLSQLPQWPDSPPPCTDLKKKIFFLERIPILRVHLLSLFIGGTFGTPCHAKFHKGNFFVHCKMKWSLFSLLSAQESCLDEVPIPGERTWRRQKETVPLHGFLLSSYCPIYKVDQNNTNNLTSTNNRATAHRYLMEV